MVGFIGWVADVTYMVLERVDPLNFDDPDDERPAVRMVGRAGGVVGFLLSLLALAARIDLRITPGEARLTQTSKLGGSQSVHIVSLQSKPSVKVAVLSPWIYLGLAVGAALLGVVTFFISFMALPVIALFVAVFVLQFFMGQCYSVSIVGPTSLNFRVYPTLFGKAKLTFDDLMDAIDLMRRLIDRVEVRTQVGGLQVAELLEEAAPAVDAVVVVADDPEADGARAYHALMGQKPAPGQPPREFLRGLRDLTQRYPNTQAAARAEFEFNGLKRVIGVVQQHAEKKATPDQVRRELRDVLRDYPETVAAAWAQYYLDRVK